MEKRFPFQNTSLPLEKRLADLMGRLTLEEKISLIPTQQAAIPRLGIEQYDIGAEGAHGFVNRESPCTTFTQTQGLACSWDRDLLRKAGKVTGEEARVFYNRSKKNGLSLWAPTIDMERDPRWGRTEEGYGEDPYLNGELAADFINGIQNDDGTYITASCAPKHFFGNNNEKFRATCNVSVDPRNMHEYYLEPFRRVYRKAAPYSLMCSYNKVNGVTMMLNPAIRDIVKNAWGLGARGQVVTDGGAVTNLIKALNKTPGESIQLSFEHGADNMNDEVPLTEAAVKEALDNHLITEKELDKHVAASLRVRFRFGHFDCGKCPMDKWGKEHYMTSDAKKLARRAVAESIVLLKNEPVSSTGKSESTKKEASRSSAAISQPLLPIHPASGKKILVTGPLADIEFPDWYTGTLPYFVSPLEGIRKQFGTENVTYVDSRDTYSFRTAEGNPLVLDKDGYLRPAHAASPKSAKSVKPSPFLCDDWGWGANTLFSKKFNAYLEMVIDPSKIDPNDPEKSKREATDFQFQAHAKTTWAWYISTLYNFIDADTNLASAKQTLAKATSANTRDVYIRAWNSKTLNLNEDKTSLKLDMLPNDTPTSFKLTQEEDGVAKAAAAAAKADIAIVVVGNNSLVNGKEEMDRPDITLPPYQKRLIRAVHEANPNTVLVMVSGYPYAIPEEDKSLPAIVYMAHGMQESGNGLANVLSGKVSPAGRLNMTWYNSVKDLPPMQNYDIISHPRTYQYFNKPVLYPFGYGLSYTNFAYNNLKVIKTVKKSSSTDMKSDNSSTQKGVSTKKSAVLEKQCTILTEEPVTVRCTITNTGSVASDEVPQLYLTFHGSRVVRPLKTLRGFQRVHILPGKSVQVDFPLSSEDTQIWDVTRNRWCIEQGTVTIAIGPSSSNVRLSTNLAVEGEVIPPRNMLHITPARNYDSYHNAFLYDRPGRDLCAVYSGASVFDTERNTSLDALVNQNEPAELVYRTCSFGNGVTRFIATIATEGACSLELRTATTTVASADLPVTGDNCAVPFSHPRPLWSTVIIPVPLLSGIQDLHIVLTGRVAIQTFRFE